MGVENDFDNFNYTDQKEKWEIKNILLDVPKIIKNKRSFFTHIFLWEKYIFIKLIKSDSNDAR